MWRARVRVEDNGFHLIFHAVRDRYMIHTRTYDHAVIPHFFFQNRQQQLLFRTFESHHYGDYGLAHTSQNHIHFKQSLSRKMHAARRTHCAAEQSTLCAPAMRECLCDAGDVFTYIIQSPAVISSWRRRVFICPARFASRCEHGLLHVSPRAVGVHLSAQSSRRHRRCRRQRVIIGPAVGWSIRCPRQRTVARHCGSVATMDCQTKRVQETRASAPAALQFEWQWTSSSHNERQIARVRSLELTHRQKLRHGLRACWRMQHTVGGGCWGACAFGVRPLPNWRTRTIRYPCDALAHVRQVMSVFVPGAVSCVHTIRMTCSDTTPNHPPTVRPAVRMHTVANCLCDSNTLHVACANGGFLHRVTCACRILGKFIVMYTGFRRAVNAWQIRQRHEGRGGGGEA